MSTDCRTSHAWDSSSVLCLIHGVPTDLEVGNVYEDRGKGQVARGPPASPPSTASQRHHACFTRVHPRETPPRDTEARLVGAVRKPRDGGRSGSGSKRDEPERLGPCARPARGSLPRRRGFG